MASSNSLRHPLTRIGLASIALLLFLTLSGCGFDTHQSVLNPQGPVARMQLDLFYVTLWVTGFLFVTVGGALAWAVWRYRARPGDETKPLPEQSHGSAVVEVGLIFASAVMLVFIAVPTLQGIMYMHDLPPGDNNDAIKIKATGYQWWWEFEYPDKGLITANEMVVPVGRPIHLELLSADVNHSFWLPRLAGKTDLIPGQTNRMWFQADETGTFWGQCAEFCGDSHAFMLFRVHVVSNEEYEAWILKTLEPRESIAAISEAQPAENSEKLKLGHQLFLANCATCHRVDVQAVGQAPNLHNIASRTTLGAGWLKNTEENLHRWIQVSEKIKPGNLMYNGWEGMVGLKDRKEVLTDENVEAIIAYLNTLR